MALLHLLALGIAGVLTLHLLAFSILLLMKRLAFSFLLGRQLVATFLISAVHRGVATVRGFRPASGGNISSASFGILTRRGVGAPRGRRMDRSCHAGAHDAAAAEFSWLRSCGDGRRAVVDGRAELAIGTSVIKLSRLSRHRSHVPHSNCCFFLGGWTGVHSAFATVEADTTHGAEFVIHSGVVDVVDDGDIYVAHIAVIREVSVLPSASVVAVAEIAESVVDAAVESDGRSPVACAEEEAVRSPGPIARRPKDTDLWRIDPRAGHPVIIADGGIPSPIAGRPDVIMAGTNWLRVDWQLGRSEIDEDSDSNACLRRTRRERKEHSRCRNYC